RLDLGVGVRAAVCDDRRATAVFPHPRIEEEVGHVERFGGNESHARMIGAPSRRVNARPVCRTAAVSIARLGVGPRDTTWRMEAWKLAERTWTDLEGIDPSRAVALLPVGAIEAHGPHLPLNTDVLIAEAMVARAAELLNERGMHPLILPPVAYSAAEYAEGFPGTISIRPETVTSLLLDIAGSVKRAGIELLAVANAHLDPARS